MLGCDVTCIPEPTLHQFDTGGAPLEIDFINKLGEGVHSYVWKARINGNIYALKLFTDEQDRGHPSFREMFGSDDARWPYIHAFPNEYRAFARLKEFGQEHLAVACYGWIELDQSHYDFMDRHISKQAWFRGRKRYAIVKELLDFDYPRCCHEDIRRVFVSPKMVKETFQGLRTMHRLGIFVGDIKEDNISGGKYVDFSRSWTAPHPYTADPGKFSSEGPPFRDADNLEVMVHGEDGWNELFPAEKILDRLLPSLEHLGKLRSNKGLSEGEILEKCFDSWPGHPENFTYDRAKKLFRWGKFPGRKAKHLKTTKHLERWNCEPCEKRREMQRARRQLSRSPKSSCSTES
ncbi:hypothetical protein PG985_009417 [Apiospora marii]|uniref:Protein kinase domain-containing protein n=1 Tax=Apiospora marii TaxID=335849 RepID=A0ABR1RF70_9PEZI